MALAGSARWTTRADAGHLSQRQRADGNRPEFADDTVEPAPDIPGRFILPHVYVRAYMYTIQFSRNSFWRWGTRPDYVRAEQGRLLPPALVVFDGCRALRGLWSSACDHRRVRADVGMDLLLHTTSTRRSENGIASLPSRCRSSEGDQFLEPAILDFRSSNAAIRPINRFNSRLMRVCSALAWLSLR